MIYLWRTDRLVNVLVNEQLTETDSRNYMVVSALIYTYIIYSGLWFGGSREWMLLFEAVMTLGICVVGINECFKANGGSAGTQFLIRLRVSRILCKLILLGGVETIFKADHKLTHRLFPVLNWHCPAFSNVA